jgi:hypothetical protein
MKRYLPMFLFLPVAFFLFVYSWAQGLLMGWFARISGFKNNILGVIMALVQFTGLIALIYFLMRLKLKINLAIKIIIILVSSFLILSTGILAWMTLYYLINTPQIG